MLYGGGLGGGKVIGQSDKQGGEPNSTPYDPGHLISTILRTMIDPGELRLLRYPAGNHPASRPRSIGGLGA